MVNPDFADVSEWNVTLVETYATASYAEACISVVAALAAVAVTMRHRNWRYLVLASGTVCLAIRNVGAFWAAGWSFDVIKVLGVIGWILLATGLVSIWARRPS
jgi:hypothetical protein